MESPAEAEKIGVQTGPSPHFASLGDRFLAQVVDTLVWLGLFFFFGFLISGTGKSGSFNLKGGPALLVICLVSALILAYFIVAEALSGVTLGKLTAGIRVGHETEPAALIGWHPALVRNLMRIVDVLPLFYLVGAVSFLLTKHSQRLGDRVAKTVVTEDRREPWIRAGALACAVVFLIVAIVIGKHT